MTDPLSIVAGVLTILGACCAGTKTLRSVYAAPQELARLEIELDHLHDIIREIHGLTFVTGLTSNVLIKNLTLSRSKLQEVHEFIHDHLRHRSLPFTEIKRTTLARHRGKLRVFARDIQTARAHMLDGIALSHLSNTFPRGASKAGIYPRTCTLRVPVEMMGNHCSLSQNANERTQNRDQPLEYPSQLTIVSPFIRQCQENLPVTANSARMPMVPNDGVLRQQSDVVPAQGQVLNNVGSYVLRHQHYIIGRDHPLYDYHALTERKLSESHTPMDWLLRNLATDQVNDITPSYACLRAEAAAYRCSGGVGPPLSETPSDSISDAIDVFDDCVSHLSEDQAPTPIDRLRAHFSNRMSMDDFFRTPLTFIGEQYTTETRLGEPGAVAAMTELYCSSTHRQQKYFLIYAEGPRLWRRVTVSATIKRASQSSVKSDFAAPDNILSGYKTLPRNLHRQLQGLLAELDFFETVTKVSLKVVEQSKGNYAPDLSSLVISEDLDETHMSREEEMLRDVDDLNCPKYLEGNVITQGRIDAMTHIARVGSSLCLERKMPFSGGGLPGDDGVKRFWEDLKLVKSLKDCNGFVKFIGVVLDDTRKHLKSFLQELPILGTIRSIFDHAELRGERIPWSIRATWATQIITAVAEIHAKGFFVGLLHISFIGVRSDGSAVLNLRKRGYKSSINREGEIAPESRTVPVHSPQLRELNFRTDIFMLGMLLWHLAEHRTTIVGYLCLKYACTSVPRHSCKDEHINPIELPPCNDKEVPAAFNVLISLCRQADPKKRPPARTLLRCLNVKDQPPEMAHLQMKYANIHNHLVSCDECGAVVDLDGWYHCNICHLSDFDLCSYCVSQGIHCYDPEHGLVKRVFKNGSIENVL